MKFFTKVGLFLCLVGLLFFIIPPTPDIQNSQVVLYSFGIGFFFVGGFIFCFIDDEKKD